MQAIRGLGFVGVLGACWFVAAGCSSDTNANLQSDAGSGGSGVESGGTRGNGGKTGSGGKATGGTTGSGGSAAGGTNGSGGHPTGGASGSGGSGGTDASASGGAADSGSPDSGDAGTVKTAKSCGYRCATNADCLTGPDGGPGPDATYQCNSVRKRCENPIEVCNSNADCVALASFWLPPCTIDDDCFPGDVCVDAGGYGMCATLTPADAGACSFLAPEAVVRQKFGASGSVTVCGSTAGRCNDHRCSIGCASDGDCGAAGPTCNTTSGLCECSTNADCTATGVSVCNGTTHQCECATNADCAGVPGGDVCVAGKCGCSGTSVCTVPFRSTTSVCE